MFFSHPNFDFSNQLSFSSFGLNEREKFDDDVVVVVVFISSLGFIENFVDKSFRSGMLPK